jgi:hypothetical protein
MAGTYRTWEMGLTRKFILNEEEVKKGFEEAADQVSEYFGWDNDKIIPNEKDKENNTDNYTNKRKT